MNFKKDRDDVLTICVATAVITIVICVLIYQFATNQ